MKLYDNYGVADELIILFTAIRDAFDKNREEFNGVEEDVMIKEIMKLTNGRFNIAQIKLELERFKK